MERTTAHDQEDHQVTDRARRFWGVGDDGKVGLLSGWHALVVGAVLSAGAVWFRNWWGFAAMAILVLRAVIALWLARTADRPQAPTAADRADDAQVHADR
jgi:hypothetical protein